ncbi:MAG: hypothetical protein GX571_05395, partial [Lentisphaerae bacterium]|nr:hypothetical protein [Lentisphaerota bacterium]
YVMTADIYSVAPHTGRGGWSWYTGAAAWMYRLAVETLLGLERHPDHLKLVPRLPSTAPGHFKVTYRHGGATYHIAVQPAPPGDAPGVVVDGTLRPDGQIPLHDDGRDHVVTVTWN